MPAGAYYLGRPWRNYSRVVFQQCSLSEVINSGGWRIWNEGDERTNGVFYGEFGNSGPGAKGRRASFARTLDRPVTVDEALGRDARKKWWWDAEWLG